MDLQDLHVSLILNAEKFISGLDKSINKLDSFAKKNEQTLNDVRFAYGAFGTAIVGGFGLSVKAASDFEKAIKQTTATTGKTGKEFIVLRDKISSLSKTLSSETIYSFEQISQALRQFVSEGIDVSKMTEKQLLPALDVAKLTGTDLNTVMNMLVQSSKIFGVSVSDMGDLLDNMAKNIGLDNDMIGQMNALMNSLSPIAKSAGINLKEMVAIMGQIDTQGIPATRASMSLREAFLNLTNATPTLIKTLKELGLNYSDIDLKGNGFLGTLSQLDKAGMNQIQMFKIFGERSGALIDNFLKLDLNGKKVYENLILQTKALGTNGEFVRNAVKESEGYSDSLAKLGNNMKLLQVNIGQSFIPIFADLTNGLVIATKGISEFSNSHQTLTKWIAGTAVAFGGLLGAISAAGFAMKPFIESVKIINKLLVLSTLKEYTLGLNALKLGYVGIAAELILLTKAYYDYNQVMNKTNAISKTTSDIVSAQIGKLSSQIELLKSKKDELSEADKKEIENIQSSIETIREKNIVMATNSEFTAKDKTLLMEQLVVEAQSIALLNQEISTRKGMYDIKQQNISLTDLELKGIIDTTLARQEQSKSLADSLPSLISFRSEYLSLIDQLNNGKITSEEFMNNVNRMSINMEKLGLNSEEVANNLSKFYESALGKGFIKDTEAVNKEIRQMTQELVLDTLEGTDKEIQSHKYWLQNKLDDIRTAKEEKKRALEEETAMSVLEAKKQIDILKLDPRYAKDEEMRNRLIKFETDKLRIIEDYNNQTYKQLEKAYDKEAALYAVQAKEKLKSLEDQYEAQKDMNSVVIKFIQENGLQNSEFAKNWANEWIKAAATVKGEINKAKNEAERKESAGGASSQTPSSTTTTKKDSYTWDEVVEAGGHVSLQGYAIGTKRVPKTKSYLLHKDEMVIPANQAETIRRVVNSSPKKRRFSGGSISTINQNTEITGENVNIQTLKPDSSRLERMLNTIVPKTMGQLDFTPLWRPGWFYSTQDSYDAVVRNDYRMADRIVAAQKGIMYPVVYKQDEYVNSERDLIRYLENNKIQGHFWGNQHIDTIMGVKKAEKYRDSFLTGSWDVPETGNYRLHKKEAVLPSSLATLLRDKMSDGQLTNVSQLNNPSQRLIQNQSDINSQPITIINRIDPSFIEEAINSNDMVKDTIINTIGKDAIRGGKTSKIFKMR